MNKPAPNNNASACPDCDTATHAVHGVTPAEAVVDRRRFLAGSGAVALAAAASQLAPRAVWAAPAAAKKTPETLTKQLYDSLSEKQRRAVVFGWDHEDDERGLLRTHVSANWNITKPDIASNFFNKNQKEIIRAIFEGLYQPEWVAKIDKQLKDDAGGYGRHQNIAIFGEPGAGKFELVFTGRHMTIRCDGNSTDHMAFGGPIFYGHAAESFNEKPHHPGNVFWEQAIQANQVYAMLDGKQRKAALVKRVPDETAISFQGAYKKPEYPGIPITELTGDQKEVVQKTLAKLIEPYRDADRQEVMQCLQKQGGLDHCSLAFYQEDDLGSDGVWDNFRLEGPSFVWYFRGSPHVHVWVNVGDNPSVATNS